MKRTIQKNLLLGLFSSLSWMGTQAQPLEWGGRFGGIGEDVVRKLYVDPAGNSYTTGYFTDSADFDITTAQHMATANGFFDVFVQKTGPGGNLIWAKSFGSTSFEYGTGVMADAQGNVYVTGVFDTDTDFDPGAGEHILSTNGQQDIFLVKLDAAGNFSWAGNIGGGAYDESTAVGVDGAGNVYLSGYFNDTADFNPGPATLEMTSAGMNDNFVAKFSSDGELIWAKQYGSPDFEGALSMKVTASGEQYITGFYNGTADFDPGAGVFEMSAPGSGNTGFLLKLNSAGDFQLARSFGGTDNVISYDVDLDAAGNIYLAGNFAGTIDLDPGAGTVAYTSAQYNGFVLKLDPAANFVWAKNIASAEAVMPYTVDVNAFGYVTTSGYIETTTDFDPDPVTVFELALSSGNAMGAFISILDSNGDFVQAMEFGGCNFADYHGAYSDADNNLYVAGAFETTVDLNPALPGMQATTAMDFRDNYLLKLEPIVFLEVPETGKEAGFSLFPNPAGDVAVLQVNSAFIGEGYVVYDQMGRMAMKGNITSEINPLDVSALSKGMYVLHLQGNAQLKFVKN
jgi:hypothetical protein